MQDIGSRPLRHASLLVALALALAACTSDDPGGRSPTGTSGAAYMFEQATQPGPYGVGMTTLTFTDTTRPTAPNGDYPGSPERTITVHVWYPAREAAGDGRDAPLDAAAGPYPLLVFAHGFTSLPAFTSGFLRHMASHGYVVAAPEFPLTKLGAPGGARFLDILNQPADISFVVDEMVRLSSDAGHPLAGALDAKRIGLAGHSGGAYTANLALYGPDRDARLDAALVISGDRCLEADEAEGETDAAVMFMAGSEDLLVPSEASRVAYEAAEPPRYWVELRGGSHIRFTDVDLDDSSQAERVRSLVGAQIEPGLDDLPDAWEACRSEPQAAGEPPMTLARQQELLRAFATPFFDAYLRGDDDALRLLHDGLAAATGDAVRYEFDVD